MCCFLDYRGKCVVRDVRMDGDIRRIESLKKDGKRERGSGREVETMRQPKRHNDQCTDKFSSLFHQTHGNMQTNDAAVTHFKREERVKRKQYHLDVRENLISTDWFCVPYRTAITTIAKVKSESTAPIHLRVLSRFMFQAHLTCHVFELLFKVDCRDGILVLFFFLLVCFFLAVSR